jgi:hypothetical protein
LRPARELFATEQGLDSSTRHVPGKGVEPSQARRARAQEEPSEYGKAAITGHEGPGRDHCNGREMDADAAPALGSSPLCYTYIGRHSDPSRDRGGAHWSRPGVGLGMNSNPAWLAREKIRPSNLRLSAVA